MVRRIIFAVFALVIVAAGAYLAGPRVDVDTRVTFDSALLGKDAEAWLAQSEAGIPGIRPGLAKEIAWASPTKARTPLAIVYIHGFSASKGEIRPVPDKVAGELGANLFFTRLAGHGRDSAAMAEASVNDWVNDYAEAIAVGRAIGEKVVVIAMSTGGSLASWAATQPALSQDVAGMVLIAPNYGVQASGAWLLTKPWGLQIAELVAGTERGFEPRNEARAKFWTYRYPTSATLPMAALTDLARNAPVETADIPVLFIYSQADSVVRPELTRDIAERWGAPSETMMVEGSDDPSNHVITGDAASPSTNTLVAGRITEWIRSVTR